MKTTDGITTTDVKRMNKNRIFKMIHGAGGTSRQEIADRLQLSLPTVNQNLRALTQEDLITFDGNFESTGGRKAQVIAVNGNAHIAVSVNICSDIFCISVINLNGEIINTMTVRMPFSEDETYGSAVADYVGIILKKTGLTDQQVLGVGVTIPGIFDNRNELLLAAPPLGIRNYPISRITQHISYPCLVMNDARSEAYAEYWFASKAFASNNGKKLDSRIYLMLNTGVGGASINGQEQITAGVNNRFGEFGHMTIHPDGRQCMCGRKGCFEAYTSADRLSSDFQITLEEFFEELRKGNSSYKKVFDTYLDNLAIGVNNLYTLNDCDIVIGGPVARFLQPYQEILKEKLIDRYSFDTNASYLHFANCTPQQAETGAAIVFIGEFIRNI